jgi:secretin/TonB-like protein
MLALLATIALLQSTEADPAPPPPPPALAPLVEREVAPLPPPAPAPPPPRAAKAPPAPPAAPLPPVPPRRPAAPAAAGEVLRGDWPEKASGKRVTIDEHGSVDDTVGQIAEVAGWNLVLNTGRVGERLLRLRLKDVPVEEALRAALQGTGLAATRRGDVVVVAPGIEPVTERATLSGFDKPSGKRFTGDFEGESGRDALLQIGKASGLSIVLPQGTLGKVTAHFKDVPVEEALKAVLAQAGLQAVREGSVVTVFQREEGLAGRFTFSGELGPEIGKTVEEAMRTAERELRRAEREARKGGKAGPSRDRERVGGDVVVEAGEDARDVHAVGGNVTLKSGAEAREVVAIGGSVTLEAGATAQQAVAVGGDVRVGPGATVVQDAVSVGGKVQVDPSGDVGGEQTAVSIPGVSGLIAKLSRAQGRDHHSPAWSLAGALARYAVYLALSLLVVLLFQRRVEVVATSIENDPAKALLAGLLGLVAQPFLAILLIVTLVGIPLVLVQVLGVLVAGVFGFTALAWWLGRRLPVRISRGAMVLQLALGMAIVFVATQIPVVGWLAWTAAVIITFGAVLRTRFGQEPVLPTSAPPPAPPPFVPPPPAPAA